MIGETLGSFRIVSQLGAGGMGVIYQAEHAIIGKRAAVKVLRAELSRDREVIGRFFNEAKAVTAIDHPGLVDVYDFGYATDGSAYIVMELLAGESLATRLRRERGLPLDVAVALTRQLCGALGAAHAHRIVHRDLKPDNIYLTPDPDVAFGLRAKVLDFGIAKLAPGLGGLGTPETQTGALLGTPLYMAPEQCRGAGEVDHRTDIYALGVILFEMVTGRVPFMGVGMGEIIAMHQMVAPPSPRALVPALAPALDALILKMLAKQPGDRPQSMQEIVAALDGRAPAYSAPMASAVPQPPLASQTVATFGTAPTPFGAVSAPLASPAPYTPHAPPMRRKRGALYATLGVVAAGAIAAAVIALHHPAAKPSATAATFALLPPETELVMHLDVAKLEQSGLWRAEGTKFVSLFAHIDDEHLLDKLRTRCDLDPPRDLRAVSYAYSTATHGPGEGAVLIDGDWDRDKLERCIATLWPETAAAPQPPDIAGGPIRRYDDVYIMWVAPHVAAIGNARRALPYMKLLAEHAAAVATGSGSEHSAADRSDLARVAAAIPPDAVMWFAGAAPGGLPNDLDPFRALDHATQTTLWITTGDALDGHFELTATPARATDLAQQLAAQAALLRAKLPIFDEIHATTHDGVFAIDVHLDPAKLAALAALIDAALDKAIREADGPPLGVGSNGGSDVPLFSGSDATPTLGGSSVKK